MEDLDNETIEELKAKAIERGGDEIDDITTNELQEDLEAWSASSGQVAPEPPTIIEEEPVKEVKKPKKQRSEKQKAAFEKARLKRAENLKVKKQIEAEKKQKQKEEKEQVKIEVKKRLQKNKEDLTTKEEPIPLHNPTRPKDISRFKNDLYDEPVQRYKEQVVNNYYYYGTPPPDVVEEQKPKRGRKKKVKSPPPPPEPESSSESETEEEIIYSDPDEPQSYKELQNYQEEAQRAPPPAKSNGLKFRFA